MKNIFEMKTNNRIVREKYKLNLNIPRTNKVKFGTNSSKTLKLLKQLKNGMVHHVIV